MLKGKLVDFKVFGKSIKLKIDKDEMADFIREKRVEFVKTTGNAEKSKFFSYMYTMVVGKILEQNKEVVLNSLT
jgi:glycine cleavage system H lipoate-binding protein